MDTKQVITSWLETRDINFFYARIHVLELQQDKHLNVECDYTGVGCVPSTTNVTLYTLQNKVLGIRVFVSSLF